MAEYVSPLQDMEFLLFDVFNAPNQWQSNAKLVDLIDRDMASAMLAEAAKIAQQCVAPINRNGDEVGAVWHKGEVTTPKGFKEAYKAFCEAGLASLCGNPEFGGLGMPKALSVLIDEMMYAANSAFNLYPALSSGACLSIDAHASDDIKQRFLPSLYSGVWGGTMCLTEPHSGSDLGLIRTRAEPNTDGTFSLTGTKIFITGGEHDLTENIVHLVLAKLPDAPAGSKGISLFLVPKIWVQDDGSLGSANAVSCGSIEHKMGIKASSTCVMNFDGAKGYLIGEANRGLQCMFTMMNCERLSIGIQGIGCADASYQNAVEYARERLQGRGNQSDRSVVADPILVHPDVRRMLLTMKATTEAGRAFAVYLAMQLDQAKFAADESARAKADAMVALLTPVAKAFFTDMGLESTVLGQQVFGGHGYIREWGQEQLVRDVRIAQIYEGTNGIQAQDLVQRKVFFNHGEWMEAYLDEVRYFSGCVHASQLQGYRDQLLARVDQLWAITQALVDRATKNSDELGASACDYLHVVGYVTYGYLWLKMMSVAINQPNGVGCQSKLKTGCFFFNRLLPRVDGLLAAINAGSEDLMSMGADDF